MEVNDQDQLPFVVSQSVLALLMVGILIAAGVYSLELLRIETVPDVTNVQVQILTGALSLAPLEIERQITLNVIHYVAASSCLDCGG